MAAIPFRGPFCERCRTLSPSRSKKTLAPLAAFGAAQRIAFAPLLFQAARTLRDRGILAQLAERRRQGVRIDDLAARTGTSRYGVTVLLEAGLAAGIVERQGDLFRATHVGILLERDPLTRANMNFVADVCYRPAEHLNASIERGEPAGLKELGNWPTIYDGLAALGEPALSSWLAFDHFYSDDAFPLVLENVFASRPRRILDVGGNTGKFALQVLRHDRDVRITIADLPGQIASCRRALEAAGLAERAEFHPLSILDENAELPSGHDVIWMSQFLSCFGEDEILHVLSVARRALPPGGRLLVLDNLWDRQANEVGRFCLQAISLYFTCVANGKSRMYDSKTLLGCIHRSGFAIERETDRIGWGHSLIECRPAPASPGNVGDTPPSPGTDDAVPPPPSSA